MILHIIQVETIFEESEICNCFLLANSLGIHYVGNCLSPVAQTIASAVAHQLNGLVFSVLESLREGEIFGTLQKQKKMKKKLYKMFASESERDKCKMEALLVIKTNGTDYKQNCLQTNKK